MHWLWNKKWSGFVGVLNPGTWDLSEVMSSAIVLDSRGDTFSRPQRQRFEAFTADTKIIQLIRRRVALFPTAAAQ